MFVSLNTNRGTFRIEMYIHNLMIWAKQQHFGNLVYLKIQAFKLLHLQCQQRHKHPGIALPD